MEHITREKCGACFASRRPCLHLASWFQERNYLCLASRSHYMKYLARSFVIDLALKDIVT